MSSVIVVSTVGRNSYGDKRSKGYSVGRGSEGRIQAGADKVYNCIHFSGDPGYKPDNTRYTTHSPLMGTAQWACID